MAEVIELPLLGGQDTGTEPTAGARLRSMQNCFYRKQGGVHRRFGFTKQNTSSSDFSADSKYRAASAFTERPICVSPSTDGLVLYTQNYQYVLSGSAKLKRDKTTLVGGTEVLAEISVDNPGNLQLPQIYSVNCALSASGYVCVVWAEARPWNSGAGGSSDRFFSIIDANTGEFVRHRVLIDTVSVSYVDAIPFVKVIATDSDPVFKIFTSEYGADINLWTIAASTFALSSTVTTFGAGILTFDVKADRANPSSGYAIVWIDNTTDANLRAYNSSDTGLFATITLTCASPVVHAVALDYNADNIAIAYTSSATNNELSYASYTDAGASVRSAITTTTGRDNGIPWLSVALVTAGASGKSFIAFSEAGSYATTSSPYGTLQLVQVEHSGSGTFTRDALCTGYGTHAQLQSAIYYDTTQDRNLAVCSAMAATENLPFPTSGTVGAQNTFLMGWTTPTSTPTPYVEQIVDAGAMWHSNGFRYDGAPVAAAPVPTLIPDTTRGCFWYAAPRSSPNEYATSLLIYKIPHQFAGGTSYTLPQTCVGPIGPLCPLGGLRYWDGATLGECSLYAHPTEFTASTTKSTAGYMTQLQSYEYGVLYSKIDAKNQQLRSAPFTQTETLTGTNDEISAPFQLAYFTDHIGNGTIAVEGYRTTGNGSTLYFETVRRSAYFSGSGAMVYAIADAELDDHEQIYTNLQLENVPVPGGTAVAYHGNRIWLGGTPDDTLWYSKEYVEREVPGFSEGLTFQPFEGGRIVALMSQDSALLVLKERGIWGITGAGPNDMGEDGLFSTPQKINSDTGCVDRRSVVSAPFGTLFRGRRGIYLITRELGVEYIGREIENDLTSSVTITDAVLYERDSQVWFFTDTANIYVFDYLNGSWSVFSGKNGSGVALAPRVGCVLNGDLYFADQSLDLYKYDRSTHIDGGADFVVMDFQAGYVHPGSPGVQGWQRIRRVFVKGEKYTEVTPTVTLYFDYDSQVSESRSWTSAQAAAWGSTLNRQMEIIPARQKCQSISVRFSDAAPSASTGTGQGFSIQSICLEVVPKATPVKLRASQVQ